MPLTLTGKFFKKFLWGSFNDEPEMNSILKINFFSSQHIFMSVQGNKIHFFTLYTYDCFINIRKILDVFKKSLQRDIKNNELLNIAIVF